MRLQKVIIINLRKSLYFNDALRLLLLNCYCSNMKNTEQLCTLRQFSKFI